jgi:hypothetical protein
MADLIYPAITTLDGYVADEQGNFDWAAPNEQVHAFVNDLERPVGTRVRLELGLADERRFDSGVVFLRYRITA